jgi:hypothetical protein
MAKAKDIFPADDDEAALEYIERQLYERDDPGVPTPDVEVGWFPDQVEGGAHVTATAATNVDRAEAERFLSIIGRGATRFTFQTFDDNADRKDENLARIIHGTLAGCFDDSLASAPPAPASSSASTRPTFSGARRGTSSRCAPCTSISTAHHYQLSGRRSLTS